MGDDPRPVDISGYVSCELKNISWKVLHDSSEVDGHSGSDMLGLVALAQITVYSINGELKFTAMSTVTANDLECKTTFTVNKTTQWMLGMAGEEKRLAVEHARIDAKIDPKECKVQKNFREIFRKNTINCARNYLTKKTAIAKNRTVASAGI